MITVRQAITMIEAELSAGELMILQRKELNEFMDAYVRRMVHLADSGKSKNFEILLMVSKRLFSEGNQKIRDAMQRAFVSNFCQLFERKPELLVLASKSLNGLLLKAVLNCQFS